MATKHVRFDSSERSIDGPGSRIPSPPPPPSPSLLPSPSHSPGLFTPPAMPDNTKYWADIGTMYCLIIAINEYQHERMPSLNAAVADGENLTSVITSYIPSTTINKLYDRDATRRNIAENLDSISHNDAIPMNAPIVIYFAGHGTRALLDGYTAEQTQILCPYDFDPDLHAQYRRENPTSAGNGIPDLVFANLLQRIADKKGSNIEIILDCCHSGSSSRDVAVTRVRGIDLPQDYRVSIAPNEVSLVRNGTSTLESNTFWWGVHTGITHYPSERIPE
ncbi:hypothetical protein BDQ12DRAFT_398515 [Crucibulum laeve]|uniref:Peptidase C14 caspase domain-containing protein n=1 Tax=Crucibulum laeve TaxID=68775 RepID=A0A5C3LNR6_9AGAR|nr:hypothetical protein BDQ12DRAFT_398515 [Crucibulum laeve]